MVRDPKPASKAIVCVEKLIDLPNGSVDASRYGSGFVYRDDHDALWLVTNWHVLTGRRPDDAGSLLGDAPQSPRSIRFGTWTHDGGSRRALDFPLYDGELRPLWRQHRSGPSIDIAALPISVSDGHRIVTIQDAAAPQKGAVEPGFDLIVIGFPFAAEDDLPYPLWKRALLASEPSIPMFGSLQMLLDTAGTPGMSGSPVFVPHQAFIDTPEIQAARDRVDAGTTSWLDEPELLGIGRELQTVELEWIGIYAGATGDRTLDRLQLGRMYAASAVDEVVRDGVPGENRYPPTTDFG